MDTEDFKIETRKLENVEILQSGVWNGIKITDKDLDKMVENFNNRILEPFLNLDHDDKFTDKVKRALKVISLGFVSQLRRDGNKLIASFKQVPVKIAELIKAGMLKKRSVEFFPKGFRVNGQIHDMVLKAVSFFGADIPAVNSLGDDFDILFKSGPKIAFTDDESVEAEKIKFNTTEGKQMETISVPKSEYDELIKSKSDVARFKSEVEVNTTEISRLKDENKELTEKLAKSDETVKELETLKKKVETEKAENLQKEADAYVSQIIKEGKLLPKFKDDKVKDYIEKANDAERLASFKEDLETRDKQFNLSPATKGMTEGEAGDDVSKLSNDELNDLIEAKMKKENISFSEAAKSFGING